MGIDPLLDLRQPVVWRALNIRWLFPGVFLAILRWEIQSQRYQTGMTTRSVMRRLAAHLEDWDWNVRRDAVEALGQMGEHAAGHVDAIAACLEDENTDVRCAAVEALGRMG